MMDYVDLINNVTKYGGYNNNTHLENPMTPVYAFGGSYGGMLATWLRMKYPTKFHGAIASSAPILWFKGSIDPNAYTKIASETLKKMYGPECYTYQHDGFYSLIQASSLPVTFANISKAMNMCENSTL